MANPLISPLLIEALRSASYGRLSNQPIAPPDPVLPPFGTSGVDVPVGPPTRLRLNCRLPLVDSAGNPYARDTIVGPGPALQERAWVLRLEPITYAFLDLIAVSMQITAKGGYPANIFYTIDQIRPDGSSSATFDTQTGQTLAPVGNGFSQSASFGRLYVPLRDRYHLLPSQGCTVSGRYWNPFDLREDPLTVVCSVDLHTWVRMDAEDLGDMWTMLAELVQARRAIP